MASGWVTITGPVDGDGIRYDVNALTVGAKFDTAFEDGCRVTVAPNPERGYLARGTTSAQVEFMALDSEGVECVFSTSMVQWIHR